MRQLSRRAESFVWKGIDLLEGAMGEITPTNNTPHATQKPSGRGKVIRVVSDDESGQLTIPIDTASQTYRDLEILLRTDKKDLNVVGVGLYKNELHGITVTYRNVSILDLPPRTFGGTESPQVTLVLGYESKETTGPVVVPILGA